MTAQIWYGGDSQEINKRLSITWSVYVVNQDLTMPLLLLKKQHLCLCPTRDRHISSRIIRFFKTILENVIFMNWFHGRVLLLWFEFIIFVEEFSWGFGELCNLPLGRMGRDLCGDVGSDILQQEICVDFRTLLSLSPDKNREDAWYSLNQDNNSTWASMTLF